jgi:hypothetical protein
LPRTAHTLAAPGASAVTSPARSTDAIAGAAVCHRTTLATSAVRNRVVSPAKSLADVGVTESGCDGEAGVPHAAAIARNAVTSGETRMQKQTRGTPAPSREHYGIVPGTA